jgi:hypothetical protein
MSYGATVSKKIPSILKPDLLSVFNENFKCLNIPDAYNSKKDYETDVIANKVCETFVILSH